MPEMISTYSSKNIIITASALFLLSVFAAILANDVLYCLVPITFLLAYQLLIDFKPIFYLLLLSTPAALEFYFDSGLSTDLPTEPLQIILLFTAIFYFILKRDQVDNRIFYHPITILIYIHFLWICIATIYSQDVLISLKYVLAKTWYIVVFYFMSAHILKTQKQFKTAFWCLFIPTLILVFATLQKHASYGWSFSDVNKTMSPWFRNHVNYAVFLALLFPFLFLAQSWYLKFSYKKILIKFSILVFAAAIYFSYTRSSWLSIVAALVAFVLIRRNLLRQVVLIAVTGVICFVVYMLHNNKYLDYAPDFTKTIYHSNFDDHMAATATLEDVSSAERIYRWIGAVKMIQDKPIIGFGPSQFYDNYKEYTVNKFVTYISQNDEKSTVHNYYLQVTVEQGFVGLFIWIALLVTVLFYVQNIYLSAESKEDKNFILAIGLSIITILINISLSDLIEANKIGTLFFMNLAILVNIGIKLKEKKLT